HVVVDPALDPLRLPPRVGFLADCLARVLPDFGVVALDVVTALEKLRSDVFRRQTGDRVAPGAHVQLDRTALDVFDLLAIIPGKGRGRGILTFDGNAVNGRLGIVGLANGTADGNQVAGADVWQEDRRATGAPGQLFRGNHERD